MGFRGVEEGRTKGEVDVILASEGLGSFGIARRA